MATNPADGNLVLSSMLDPTSLRWGSGALCDERGGACPDCILIPEVCCITRNNLLSRSVLRGMAKPHWDAAVPRDRNIEGYFEVVRRMRRMAEQRDAPRNRQPAPELKGSTPLGGDLSQHKALRHARRPQYAASDDFRN